jgi:ADP-ribose pyrophosphatase YjhB (NUDIX family)
VSNGRHMISHDVPGGRFNFRAAGIVMRDEHVLVTHSVREQHWYLPGGRVEWGESTRDAVGREIAEELGVAGEVGELAIVLENFFAYGGHRWHELAHYYPVVLPSSFPFRVDGEVCHRSHDGGVDIEFKWVRVDALAAHGFQPSALRRELLSWDSTLRHIVSIDSGDDGVRPVVDEP